MLMLTEDRPNFVYVIQDLGLSLHINSKLLTCCVAEIFLHFSQVSFLLLLRHIVNTHLVRCQLGRTGTIIRQLPVNNNKYMYQIFIIFIYLYLMKYSFTKYHKYIVFMQFLFFKILHVGRIEPPSRPGLALNQIRECVCEEHKHMYCISGTEFLSKQIGISKEWDYGSSFWLPSQF